VSFIENAKLNPRQKEAACTTEGPLLILAGAGSGKTRVLTHRIAHLIQDLNVDPWTILAITFTNKAAKEMKERVEKICGEAGENVWVSTFHSACVRILHREIEALGYSKDFTIYDDDDRLKLITELVKADDKDIKLYPPKEIKFIISDCKNKLISCRKFQELATSSRERYFGEVFERYEKKMKESSALDFDDLILKTIELFDKFPEVLSKYAHRFRYIHVDEYQDTNMAQYMLVRQLSSVWQNICVVGDDDQSIYGWRGADIRNILEFEKDFTSATVIKLEQNYRSTNNILRSANAVIANNETRKEKVLWSDKGDGSKLRVEEFADGRGEAAFVVNEIISGIHNGDSYGDYAVLYRTNSQSRLFEEMLLGSSVPYAVYGATPFYSRKEVKDAIAYLRVITNPDDEIALRRIINTPKRGIGDTAINEISSAAFADNDNMVGTILNYEASLSGRSKSKVAAFAALLDKLITDSMMLSPIEFIDTMLNDTGLRDMYKNENTDEAKDRLANIEEFYNAAASYFDENPEATLVDYLVNISLVSEPEEQNLLGSSKGLVTLMTLHSAKGLEFPNVFIVGMEEGLFPLSRSTDNKDELEEERRLCYVGITRAMKKLYLTHADMRIQYGEVRTNPSSRFLEEIPKEYCESLCPKPNRAQLLYNNKMSKYSLFENDSLPDIPINTPQKSKSTMSFEHIKYEDNKPKETNINVEWKASMKVKHRRFGIGTVISVKGTGDSTVLSVAFDSNVGVKNLVAAQAGLEIL